MFSTDCTLLPFAQVHSKIGYFGIYILFNIFLFASIYAYNVYHAWWIRRMERQFGCEKAPIIPISLNVFFKWRKLYKKDFLDDGISRMFRRHGWTHVVSTALQDTVWTADPDNIRAMLSDKFEDFEFGRLRNASFHPAVADGIFASDGLKWKNQRKIIEPVLGYNKVSDVGPLEKYVDELITNMVQEQRSSATPNNAVSLWRCLCNCMMEMGSQELFKRRMPVSLSDIVSTPSNVLYNPYTMHIVKQFERIGAGVVQRSAAQHFYPLANPKGFLAACKEGRILSEKLLNQVKANTKTSNHVDHKVDNSNPPLALVTTQGMSLHLAVSNIVTLWVAGFESSAGALSFALSLLALYPETYQKLRQDVLSVVGPDKHNINADTLLKCRYLQNVMHETLRLYPIFPINIRIAKRDTVLPTGGGEDRKSPIFIPKGMSVHYVPYVMHRREDIYGMDSLKFVPERWDQIQKPGWEYVPFGRGPRACIGRHVAKIRFTYTLARIVQHFDDLKLTGTGVNIKPGQLAPPEPKWMTPATSIAKYYGLGIYAKTEVRFHEMETDEKA